MITNLGAVVHKSGVSWWQGCRQMIQFLNLYTYLTN